MTPIEFDQTLGKYVEYDSANKPQIRVTIDVVPTFSENLAQVNGQTVNVGPGNSGTGTQRVAIASDSFVNITFPTGTETPTGSTVSVSGSVAAGKTSVTMITSSDFVGTILGVTANPSTIYPFQVTSPGKTLAAIVYTRSAGSINIFVQV